MRFDLRRVPMRLLLPLFAMLVLPACVAGPRISAMPGACSALLPDSWRVPVPGAPLPLGETVGDWVTFGDAQTGQLDKANSRAVDAIGIIERCEARDVEAVKKAKRGWFQ